MPVDAEAPPPNAEIDTHESAQRAVRRHIARVELNAAQTIPAERVASAGLIVAQIREGSSLDAIGPDGGIAELVAVAVKTRFAIEQAADLETRAASRDGKEPGTVDVADPGIVDGRGIGAGSCEGKSAAAASAVAIRQATDTSRRLLTSFMVNL